MLAVRMWMVAVGMERHGHITVLLQTYGTSTSVLTRLPRWCMHSCTCTEQSCNIGKIYLWSRFPLHLPTWLSQGSWTRVLKVNVPLRDMTLPSLKCKGPSYHQVWGTSAIWAPILSLHPIPQVTLWTLWTRTALFIHVSFSSYFLSKPCLSPDETF